MQFETNWELKIKLSMISQISFTLLLGHKMIDYGYNISEIDDNLNFSKIFLDKKFKIYVLILSILLDLMTK